MSLKKITVWLALLAILAVAFGLAGRVRAAHAGPPPEAAGTSSCLACHENLYYLRDLGRHYCLTEASARCVDCHDGDPNALQEAPAHAGLVRYPIVEGNIERCRSCHEQDAQVHVERFSALAGFSPVVRAADPAAHPLPAEAGEPERRPNRTAWLGIGLLAAVLAGLLSFCILIQGSCRGQKPG